MHLWKLRGKCTNYKVSLKLASVSPAGEVKSILMKFLLIPDKFKGSLSAREVIAAMEAGIQEVYPEATCYSVVASDGGDGFLEAILAQKDMERISHTASDPLGRERTCSYLFDTDQETAYIELAEASGLVLLTPQEYSASRTSTLGTGQQIKDAILRGARTVYIGLGGSATNDGGTGIAQALGYNFRDASGETIFPNGANLSLIQAIDPSGLLPVLRDVRVVAVNDVSNPLYGEQGAARVFAPQKGADAEEVALLDLGLKHLSELVEAQLDKDVAQVPGSGAAGGAGYGLNAFLDAEFVNGTDFLLNIAGLSNLLGEQRPDYLLTGEGRVDQQTLNGKLIQGIIGIGRKHGIPVLAVCGQSDLPASEWKAAGLADIIQIRDPAQSLEYNMQHAARLVSKAVAAYFTTRQ